jgi:predicted molibdopterin-dependent oxidoreductase YjgC
LVRGIAFDAENRGTRDGDVVALASRVGKTTLQLWQMQDTSAAWLVCTEAGPLRP